MFRKLHNFKQMNENTIYSRYRLHGMSEANARSAKVFSASEGGLQEKEGNGNNKKKQQANKQQRHNISESQNGRTLHFIVS